MKMIIIFCLIFLLITNAQSHEVDRELLVMKDCITNDPKKNFFTPSVTKITFYGDSRMDLVNKGGVFGSNSMAKILNEPYKGIQQSSEFLDDEIQNLGYEGWKTGDLKKHLGDCIPKIGANYKIAKRFVLSIGGNNFIDAGILSYVTGNALRFTAQGRSILPWALGTIFIFYQWQVVNDTSHMIGTLKPFASSSTNDIKDILLIGGYPSSSPLVLFQTTSTSNPSNPGIVDVKNIPAWASYLNVFAYPTIGYAHIEDDLRKLASDHKIHYLSVFDEMNDSSLMSSDFIHPTERGFKKWGSIVGEKLRKVKFNTPSKSRSFVATGNRWKDTENELLIALEEEQEKLAAYLAAKAELELREKRLREIQAKIRDAEYKLSLIQKRIEKVDGEIKETKAKIADLDAQIVEARTQGIAASNRSEITSA
ncbi:MAG: hypothetical protein SFU98_12745 [Leptospiraceae bacterium]|nr:hypothetical protein [Leptospiraceae bacterium]